MIPLIGMALAVYDPDGQMNEWQASWLLVYHVICGVLCGILLGSIAGLVFRAP